MERPVGERIEGGLDELANTSDAGDGAVYPAEGCEAEDLGSVVTMGTTVSLYVIQERNVT